MGDVMLVRSQGRISCKSETHQSYVVVVLTFYGWAYTPTLKTVPFGATRTFMCLFLYM
jgi:hypothetical protein